MEKNSTKLLLVLFIVTIWTTLAMAGAEINNSNLTGKYFQDFTPYAEGDVIYNAAGTSFEERNSVTFDLQLVRKDYCTGNPSECAEGYSFIPSFASYYHINDKVTLLGGFYIAAGGGRLDYKYGNSATQRIVTNLNLGFAKKNLPFVINDSNSSENMELYSDYRTLKFGASYKVSEKFSTSLGVLYMMAQKSGKGGMTSTLTYGGQALTAEIDFEQEANGTGYFVSCHYKPTELWDIALNYTPNIELKFESTIKKNELNVFGTKSEIINTGKIQEDYPATLTLGATRAFPKTSYGDFEAKMGYVRYFQKDAKWMDTFTTNKNNNRQERFDDAIEITLGGTFRPTDSKWKFHLGYLYSNAGADADSTSDFKPGLDSNSLGTGFDYDIREDLIFSLAASKTWYKTLTNSSGQKLEKDGYQVAVGFEYLF